jgi:hypothetical protein
MGIKNVRIVFFLAGILAALAQPQDTMKHGSDLPKPTTQHQILLRNGTKLTGSIFAPSSSSITVTTSDGAAITIPVGLIKSVDSEPCSAADSNACMKGKLSAEPSPESAGKQPAAPVHIPADSTPPEISPSASMAELLDALQSPRWQLRREAAATLGRRGDRAALRPLALATADPVMEVRRSATASLASLHDTASVAPLIACLKDSDGTVVKAAAVGLSSLRDSRAIEPLRSALKTCPASARLAVDMSIRVLTEIPLLIGALDNRDSVIRNNAKYLLWVFTGKDLGFDKQLWINWYLSPDSLKERRQAE